MSKPKQLKENDTIAVLTPSWGGPSIFPHVLDQGISVLKNVFKLNIKEYSNTRMEADSIYRNPKLRANAINAAFADEEVDGIISTIGGSDSIRILEYLDLDLIKKNPKVIMGYSDTTTILAYLNMHGLVTYYGASIMAGFGYLPCFNEALEEYKDVLFTSKPYELKPFSKWADKYESWNDKNNAGKVDEIKTDDIGHHWINKGASVVGKLWGGCIEVLQMMNGTFAWPNSEFFKNRIFFIETSEDKPSPNQIIQILRNYGIQNILREINGLMIARPKAYSRDEKDELDEGVRRVVIEEFGRKDLNIISNIDFGHTDPRHILPYGIDLELNPEKERLLFTEALFSN